MGATFSVYKKLKHNLLIAAHRGIPKEKRIDGLLKSFEAEDFATVREKFFKISALLPNARRVKLVKKFKLAMERLEK